MGGVLLLLFCWVHANKVIMLHLPPWFVLTGPECDIMLCVHILTSMCTCIFIVTSVVVKITVYPYLYVYTHMRAYYMLLVQGAIP